MGLRTLLIALAIAGSASIADARSLAGLWDATVTVNGLDIPFRFEITGSGANVHGAFFNGDERVRSTHGESTDTSVRLEFAQYGTVLDATVTNGELTGQYKRGSRGDYAFHARRFTPVSPAAGKVPSIAGAWNVQVKSSKGELAWRLLVRQSGAEASAAILRVDGDTGTLTGAFRDGHFVLSHFSGSRPSLVEITPAANGTLEIVQNRKDHYVAYREDEAKARNLPQPSDPSRFTTVADPTQPLAFSFPDLAGHIVTNSDPRFHGKVVIISITGSWCPNCHDEAPFLVDLYRRYHGRGLEVVALSFEEADQLKDPVRLRAFIKQYGIDYTVLLAGEPEQLAAKLPQARNLSSFPTMIFVGRDGLVRGAHAGFPGRASGAYHEAAKRDVTAEVERLLREGQVPTSSGRR